MRRHSRHYCGFTIAELIIVTVVMVFIVSIGVMLFPIATQGSIEGAKRLKDATMQEQLHQSMMIWARDFDGQYPLPGLINRLPDPELDMNTPNTGPEDFTLNHTAPLYSAMIAQNYFTPALVVSPLEPSSRITEKEDYDYSTYNPVADSYWDNTFSADLRSTSHTSYAHMALCGERKHKYWRDTMASTGVPLLGTRGPKDGATTGPQYRDSITLLFSGPEDQWFGNVVLSSGVQHYNSLEPPDLQTPGAKQPYNLFRMDGGALGISIASTEDDVTRVWDPLVQ